MMKAGIASNYTGYTMVRKATGPHEGRVMSEFLLWVFAGAAVIFVLIVLFTLFESISKKGDK